MLEQYARHLATQEMQVVDAELPARVQAEARALAAALSMMVEADKEPATWMLDQDQDQEKIPEEEALWDHQNQVAGQQ